MRNIILLTWFLSTACTQPALVTSAASSPSTISLFGNGTWPTLSAGDNNDWWDTGDPFTCYHYSTFCGWNGDSSGTSAVTGLDASYLTLQCDSEYHFVNFSAYPILLKHQNSGSTSANRLTLLTGHDEVLRPGREFRVLYACDHTTTPTGVLGWREVGTNTLEVDDVTVSTPSRSLGTAFRPSAYRMTDVHYSVEIDSTITISGGASGRIELLSDSANPPTTIRASIPGGLTGTVVVGVSVTQVAGGELSYTVPAGDYVLLRSVTVSGTPTYSITRQVEETQ